MRALVLGGTGMLGASIVRALHRSGAEVWVLHRGTTPAHLPAAVQVIHTDRRRPTAQARRALARGWDVVIDITARTPADLHPLAAHLQGRVGHLILISSAGVYARPVRPGTPIDEGAPLLDPTTPPGSGTGSGLAKLACERLAARLAPATLLRPGLITGPGDTVGRFAYWVDRAARSGTLPVPMDPAQRLTCLDSRDLASFTAHIAQQGPPSGIAVFNLRGHAFSAAEFFTVLDGLFPDGAHPQWVDGRVLCRRGVRPWRDIPLWLPADHPEYGLMFLDDTRARCRGLAVRPLADTLHASRPSGDPRCGPTPNPPPTTASGAKTAG